MIKNDQKLNLYNFEIVFICNNLLYIIFLIFT